MNYIGIQKYVYQMYLEMRNCDTHATSKVYKMFVQLTKHFIKATE